MAGPNIQETFATASVAVTGVNNVSDTMVVPTGTTTARLTTTGLSGANQLKTQKRTAGATYVDQTTYNSDQTNVAITVAAGEEWRIVQILQAVNTDVKYKFSCES